MASAATWILYGANGYTGRLIAQRAVATGLRPIVAGRNAEQVAGLAATHSLESRVFSLDKRESIAQHLAGVALVLNCAGPFADTAPAMIDACLAMKSHYLDITGEIDAIEYAHGHDAQA